ncbi:MAG: acyl-CoA reductase [Bacteroidetes bacterium]|nr:acyl-CoA reductase [Bacteroidota bacterium]
MELKQRIFLMDMLGKYILENGEDLREECSRAEQQNPWFSHDFIFLSLKSIREAFLQKSILEKWAVSYPIKMKGISKKVGLTLAGNIPLVGFHDFLCVFISGHQAILKLSSKDEVLMTHFITKLIEWDGDVAQQVSISSDLKNCDAYIATGSNNSARYFEFYFQKYPHIIRKNRTSVAILYGQETASDLSFLADDMMLYYGMGCRNVSHLFVPKDYDFLPLLNALKKYHSFIDFHKYKNNYDYRLSILLMNQTPFMDSGGILLIENESLFAQLSCIHYSYYQNEQHLHETLQRNDQIQCIVGFHGLPFGKTQYPSIQDFADGIDTMQFLCNL